MLTQSMPMAALFLRNKFIGWLALVQSIHYYLNTDLQLLPASAESNPLDQFPIMKVLISFFSLLVCYLGLVFPQQMVPPKKSTDDK